VAISALQASEGIGGDFNTAKDIDSFIAAFDNALSDPELFSKLISQNKISLGCDVQENILDAQGNNIATFGEFINQVKSTSSLSGFFETILSCFAGGSSSLEEVKTRVESVWDLANSKLSYYWAQLVEVIPQGVLPVINWFKALIQQFSFATAKPTTIEFTDRAENTTGDAFGYVIAGAWTTIASVVGTILISTKTILGAVLGTVGVAVGYIANSTLLSPTYITVNDSSDDMDFSFPIYQKKFSDMDVLGMFNNTDNFLKTALEQEGGFVKLQYPGFDIYCFYSDSDKSDVSVEIHLTTSDKSVSWIDELESMSDSIGIKNLTGLPDSEKSMKWTTVKFGVPSEAAFTTNLEGYVAKAMNADTTTTSWRTYDETITQEAAQTYMCAFEEFCMTSFLVWLYDVSLRTNEDTPLECTLICNPDRQVSYHYSLSNPIGLMGALCKMRYFHNQGLGNVDYGFGSGKQSKGGVFKSWDDAMLQLSLDGTLTEKYSIEQMNPFSVIIPGETDGKYEFYLDGLPADSSGSTKDFFFWDRVIFTMCTGIHHYGSAYPRNAIVNMFNNYRQPLYLEKKTGFHIMPPKYTRAGLIDAVIAGMGIAATIVLVTWAVTRPLRIAIQKKRMKNITTVEDRHKELLKVDPKDKKAWNAAYKKYRKAVFANNMRRLVIGGAKASYSDFYSVGSSSKASGKDLDLTVLNSSLENLNSTLASASENIPTVYGSGIDSVQTVDLNTSLLYQAVTGRNLQDDIKDSDD
jgi:hypothetical protein